MLEVEGDPDMRGRPVGERREGEGEMGWRWVRWAACASGGKRRKGRQACFAVRAEKGRKVEQAAWGSGPHGLRRKRNDIEGSGLGQKREEREERFGFF
jgi:hypothetical protein